jgi:hypothetical protein
VLNVAVPTLLIPVAAEVATVAPVIAQVNLVTVQLSPVVGLGVTTEAVHNPIAVFAVRLAGQVIVGAMLSVTVTVNEHVAVSPAESVTVYVTVVTPVLKVAVPTLLIPVAAEVATVAPVIAQVNLVTVQLSPVVGLVVAIEAVHNPVAVFAVIFDGQEIVGAILSVTVTVNEQVAVSPALSVTV